MLNSYESPNTQFPIIGCDSGNKLLKTPNDITLAGIQPLPAKPFYKSLVPQGATPSQYEVVDDDILSSFVMNFSRNGE